MAAREPAPDDSSARAVPDRFESFDLLIERIGETYRAHVTDSPVGQRAPVEIDPAGLGLGDPGSEESTEATRDVRRRPVDRDDLRRLGEGLFRTVIVKAVAEAFRTAVERTRHQGAGLRVSLQLDRAPELAALPWEALWDPEARAFLADQPNLSVVRTLGVSAETPVVTPAQAPLRVLALLPEPRGEGRLSGSAEWRQIQEHLTPLVERGELAADRLEPPTLDALGRRIDKGPCHVLHVVAHGGPGGPGAGGLLKLEDANGKPDPVSGGDLARALERRTAPRLVVLSICHGARTAVDDAFDGMAQHLLSRGIPAVVAMRTAISDAAAVPFAAALYRELAKGRTVEGAMAEARRALSLGKHRTEWATPVLYLRVNNVRILDADSNGRYPPTRRRAGGRFRKAVFPTAAIVAAGLSGVWMWQSGVPEVPNATVPAGAVEPESCPPPLGLADLQFVKVGPGVIDLGDRKVTVEEAFCIGTKEVSRGDWLAVMGGELPRSEWPLDWPMTVATPDEADSFLRQLEARDPGATYRLPTNTEWELAARADQATEYFFGDDPAKLQRYGNCRNILGRDGYDGPAPIGSYEPSPWGLFDVHGNVAEWVRWSPGFEPTVDESGQELALRLGGSYNNVPRNCAFGTRSEVKADVNRSDTGFRVVRELIRRETRR